MDSEPWAADAKILGAVKMEGQHLSSIIRPVDLKKLAKVLIKREFKPGKAIIEEGAMGEEFFIIKSGSVRCAITYMDMEMDLNRPRCEVTSKPHAYPVHAHLLPDSGSLVRQVAVSSKANGHVTTLEEGAFFGEMGLLNDTPRRATVTATKAVTCLVLERETFHRLLFPLRALLDATSEKRAEMLKQGDRTNIRGLTGADSKTLAAVKLEGQPLSALLKADDINKLAKALTNKLFLANANIIVEGERGEAFFIIKTGSVAVSTIEHGQVATLEDGAFFGEMALLNDAPRRATIKALTPVTCLVLERDTFTSMLGPLRALLDASVGKRADMIKQGERADAKWFVGLVDAAYLRQSGGATMRPSSANCIREVTINTSPGATVMPEDGVLSEPNDPDGKQYELSRVTSAVRSEPLRCDITISWDASLGIAPLRIHGVTPKASESSFKRWVVLQLPPVNSRPVKLPEYVSYGDPAACIPSGWVVFQTGRDVRVHVGAR
eukprot:531090-Prymnesium_polylepis.1